MIDNSKDRAGPNATESLVSKNSVCTGAGCLTHTQRDLVPVVSCVNSWNVCLWQCFVHIHGYHPKAVCVFKLWISQKPNLDRR